MWGLAGLAQVWGLCVGTLPTVGLHSADDSIASTQTWVKAKL